MRELPILFSGAMVRALIGGSKTQTRRVFKLPSWAEWDNSVAGRGEQNGDILPKDPGDRGWYHIEELTCPSGTVDAAMTNKEGA